MATKYQVLPVVRQDRFLTVAVANPLDNTATLGASPRSTGIPRPARRGRRRSSAR